jgi:hypothetical protein
MHDLENDCQPVERADLGELLTVRIIARSTEVAGDMVRYPFIVLFVMICSRHPALDMFALPWSLVALWALIVAGLAWMAHTMRRDARKARDEVLGRLREALSSAINSISFVANSPKNKPSRAKRRVEQLRQYISEVEREDEGAFRPLFQDPLVRALALGASGGLMLIHQLLP